MAISNAQLREILLANPNVSDEKLAKAMDNYDVTPAQLAVVLRSMGSDIRADKVQSRYENAGGTKFAQQTLDSNAPQDLLSGFTSVGQVTRTGLVEGDPNEQPTLIKYLNAFKDTGGGDPWDVLSSGGNIPQGLVAIANAPWIPSLVGLVKKNYGEQAATDLENWVLAIKEYEAGTLQNNTDLLEKTENSKIKVSLNKNQETGQWEPTASIDWSAVNEGVGAVVDIVRGIATGNPVVVFRGVKDLLRDKTDSSYAAQKGAIEDLQKRVAKWAEENPNVREWVAAPTWSEQAAYTTPGGPTEYTDIGEEIRNVPNDLIEGTYTDDDGNVWAYDILGRRGIIQKAETQTVATDDDLTDNGGNNAAAELEREQAVAAVSGWLENNPNATAADIQARLDAYTEQGIDAESIFAEATGGKTVNDYVAERDAALADDGVTDDGEINPERPWLFQNGVMTNVITGEVITPPDPSLYTEGEYYSGAGSTGMNPEERKQAILDWIKFNPNASLEEIRRRMEENDVTDEEFINATGKTPEEIVGDYGTNKECGEGYHWDETSQSCVPDTTTTNKECGEGYHWDETSQSCVPDTTTTNKECGEGYHWDETSQSCVPDTTTTNKECGEGYHWDETSQSCVPDTTTTNKECGEGYHWDETSQSCVPDTTTTNKECGEGYHWDETSQSCVPDTTTTNKECGEGYHWDETSQSCVPDTPTTNKECGEGYHWDETSQSCVPDTPTTTTNKECGVGYHWDEASQSCVPDTPTTTTNKECGVGYHWDEASQSCVLDDTGTGNGTGDGTGDGAGDGTGNGLGGLFSATRTTDAILGADLQKIDANIPLLGKLVQTPAYQPMQYLLQGISQRYKV
jgi:hypothetical protein